MSKSQSRVRPNALNFRLFDHEREQLDAWAKELGVNPADMLRAWIFGYPLYRKPRCSDHHPHCEAHHYDMVESYRLERHQQEMDHEYLADHGERKFFAESGQRLITFSDWLAAQTRQTPGAEQE